MSRFKESLTVQRPAIKLLLQFGIIAVHIPNGGMVFGGTAKQRAITGSRLKDDGMRPGFPDLLLIDAKDAVSRGFLDIPDRRKGIIHFLSDYRGKIPGISTTTHVGLIECKAPGKPLEEQQIFWRDLCSAINLPWAMIDAPEQAIAAIKRWGWR